MAKTLAVMTMTALLAACTGTPEKVVEGAHIARADGTFKAPDAPTVAVLPGQEWKLPAGDIVRIAIDREVLFGEVVDVILWAHANPEKKQLVLLVKDRREKLRAMEMPPLPAEPRIRVVTYDDGKACVSLPDVDEAKCVKTKHNHVDRSYVRELVREAMKVGNLTNVGIEIERGVQWADAVRVVDGARTCCGSTAMTVGIAVH